MGPWTTAVHRDDSDGDDSDGDDSDGDDSADTVEMMAMRMTMKRNSRTMFRRLDVIL